MQLRAYSPAIDALLSLEVEMPLRFGRADDTAREKLESLTIPQALGVRQVFEQSEAECCLAALWARFDFFDAAHTIAQDISTSSGSYWHGILHRREGDFWNAKYWMRRVGDHPAGANLLVAARQLASQSGDSDLMRIYQSSVSWDPATLVDYVEQVSGKSSAQKSLAMQLQDLEWWILFDHHFKTATGAAEA